MLYITASTGVFCYDDATSKVTQVMSNKYRGGFFSKKSHGFFGICLDKNDNIIVASREKLGTPKAGKPTTDAGLHCINPATNSFHTIGYVKDVHDVHQVDIHEDIAYLTDTGKNRLVGFNLVTGNVSNIVNFGQVREDVHHINAVTVHGDQMLVGLNNRGINASEILQLPLSVISKNTNIDDAFKLTSDIISLSPYTNTHDIEPYNGGFLVCSSHDSVVIDSLTLKPVIKSENWVRGISHDNTYTWVGQSHYAKRSKRHSTSLDGTVLKINTKTMTTEDIITIPGTGQINDLQYV